MIRCQFVRGEGLFVKHKEICGYFVVGRRKKKVKRIFLSPFFQRPRPPMFFFLAPLVFFSSVQLGPLIKAYSQILDSPCRLDSLNSKFKILSFVGFVTASRRARRRRPSGQR